MARQVGYALSDGLSDGLPDGLPDDLNARLGTVPPSMYVLTTAPPPLPTGLLEGRSHRAASVVCTEDVEVMVMDREVFNRVVMDDDKGGGKNKCVNERHRERHRERH